MSDCDSDNEDSPFYFELEVDDEISFKAPSKPQKVELPKRKVETSRSSFSMPKFSIKNLATSSELFKASSEDAYDKENISNAPSTDGREVMDAIDSTPKKNYRMSMSSAVSFIDNMLRSPLLSRKPISMRTIDEEPVIPLTECYRRMDEMSDADECASLEAFVIDRSIPISDKSIEIRTEVKDVVKDIVVVVETGKSTKSTSIYEKPIITPEDAIDNISTDTVIRSETAALTDEVPLDTTKFFKNVFDVKKIEVEKNSLFSRQSDLPLNLPIIEVENEVEQNVLKISTILEDLKSQKEVEEKVEVLAAVSSSIVQLFTTEENDGKRIN